MDSVPEDYKRCGVCKIPQRRAEFYKDRSRADGLARECKSCERKRYAKRYPKAKRNKQIFTVIENRESKAFGNIVAKKKRVKSPNPVSKFEGWVRRQDYTNLRCQICGKKFQLRSSKLNSMLEKYPETAGQCCSRACSDKRRKSPTSFFVCEYCKQPFELKKWKLRGQGYTGECCSIVCSRALSSERAKLDKRECPVCGDSFTPIARANPNKVFCSKQCYWESRKRHPNQTTRVSKKAWKERRAEILEREKGICAVCEKAPAIPVHHIIQWQRTKNDNADNLIALCTTCHFTVEFVEPELLRSSGALQRIFGEAKAWSFKLQKTRNRLFNHL